MDLPYDIWLLIVSFLPERDIRKVLAVNHVLFEIAMDRIYRSIEIARMDDRTWWILQRLRDPTVASRVCSLRLRPLFENDFFSGWSRTYQGYSWKTRARKAAMDMLHIPLPLWYHHESTFTLSDGKKVSLSLHDMITMVADVLPALSNISEFTILTMFATPSPTYDMRPFFNSAFTSFGSNLLKFSLCKELEAFSNILHVSFHLPHLQELEMTFMDPFPPTVAPPNGPILQKIVAPFINRHKATIQTLSLASGGDETIDLSSLFLALDSFPSLRHIRFSFPRQYVLWSDLSGLARFLRDHADTVQHVVWSVVYIGYSPPPRAPSNLFFGTWLTNNAITFRRLKTLSIETAEDTDLDAVLKHFSHSSSTLTKIHLKMGAYLSAEHIDSLFSVLYPSTRISSLLLQVENFTPDFLIRLAEQMPGLCNLGLFVRRITPMSPDLFSEKFLEHGPVLREWRLYDIGLWSMDRRSPPSRRVEGPFMCMLASFIPSVESFWEEGRKSTY